MTQKWMGRHVIDATHCEPLDRAAAHKELSQKMERSAAEDTAYAEYKHAQHTEAAGHHLRSLRLAVSGGDRKDAEKHNTLLKLHLEKRGHNPHHPIPPDVMHAASKSKASVSGRNHPADELLVSGPLGKSAREAIGHYRLSKKDGDGAGDTGADKDPLPPSDTPTSSSDSASDGSTASAPTAPSMKMPTGAAGGGDSDAGPQHFNKGSTVSPKPGGTHVPDGWIGTVTAHHLIKIHHNGASRHNHFYEITWRTPEGKLVDDFLPQEMLVTHYKQS